MITQKVRGAGAWWIPLLLCFLLSDGTLGAYALPSVNLGSTNFLDGGPLLAKPGWYWYEFLSYSHANNFLDGEGKLLKGVCSPEFNSVSLTTEFLYETTEHILFRARGGLDIAVPAVISSHVARNDIDLTTSGAGLGDLRVGLYLQWRPVHHNDRPVWVNRVLVYGIFPTGKNEQPDKKINAGANMFGINPYWATTFYLTPDWTLSWRLYYLWLSENKKTHIKHGQAFHLNFSTAYKLDERWNVGINGYYLEQFQDNRENGCPVDKSRERVVALGPGFFYYAPREFVLFAHFYGEFAVRNRAKGVHCIFRLIKHF